MSSYETKNKPLDAYRSETKEHASRPAYASGGDAEAHGSDFGAKVGHVADKAVEKVHKAADAVNDAGHSAVDKIQHGHTAVCRFAKENPSTALLISFGAGVIIARLLPKW